MLEKTLATHCHFRPKGNLTYDRRAFLSVCEVEAVSPGHSGVQGDRGFTMGIGDLQEEEGPSEGGPRYCLWPHPVTEEVCDHGVARATCQAPASREWLLWLGLLSSALGVCLREIPFRETGWWLRGKRAQLDNRMQSARAVTGCVRARLCVIFRATSSVLWEPRVTGHLIASLPLLSPVSISCLYPHTLYQPQRVFAVFHTQLSC